MKNRNTIRVAEFEKLYYNDSGPFQGKHWKALSSYLDQVNKKEEKRVDYFRVLTKGIQFTNYVGVIQAGNLTIEVLPKTERKKTTAANLSYQQLESADATERQSWHNVLLQMLKECRLLQVKHVDYANLNLKSNSILEIYLELFLAHTEKLLHEGLVKKYRKTEGNRTAMKGQLLFAKNISQNLVHRERFYVRHTEYNRVNIFNQLLYKTIRLIPSLSTNPFLLDRVGRLLLDFPEMPDCNVSSSVFDKLNYDRKTERYKEVMLISKMLLLNYRPDITGGSENVMAILFDMNELWEEFVYRRLHQSAPAGITVSRQNSKDFWYNQTNRFYTGVRPDIVISGKDQKTVLDTKWKIIDKNRPGDDDLKQMFVYNLLWDAEKAVLLYPGTNPAIEGLFVHFSLSELRKKGESDKFFSKCSLKFITVLDEQGRLASKSTFERLLDSILGTD